jgi:hypothetical protein
MGFSCLDRENLFLARRSAEQDEVIRPVLGWACCFALYMQTETCFNFERQASMVI